jgi:hypothetical protein
MIKNVDLWLPDYLLSGLKALSQKPVPKPIHLLFCIADHFEPYWKKPSPDTALQRVLTWIEQYPKIAKRHEGADGRPPKLTLFYPEEEYDEAIFSALSDFCRQGYAEIEVHLHHDNDTEEKLREKLLGFKKILSERHGLLPRNRKTGAIQYAFIHGNWALDNSRPDGKWCGINNELTILEETGCYADFTEPSAPSNTQTEKINSIYYAIDDPNRPKSHNRGRNMESGILGQKGLVMIQGPLALNWTRRKWGLLPRIEYGALSASNRIFDDRVALWVQQGIHVVGHPDWVFVKVYGHGCQEGNMHYLLSEGLDHLFSTLERQYNDRTQYMLHYVSAREMFNVAKALEAGPVLPFDQMLNYDLVWEPRSNP